MGRIFHPLLALLASATRQELARQVAYLKEENRILRARLPERIVATPQEKRRLLRAGRRLGIQLKELMSFVTYQSFRRWIREAEENHTKTMPSCNLKPGRPRTPEDVRDLIIQMRKETAFGYTKLMGELRKLGIKISRQTVKNILKEAGLEPLPNDSKDSWDAFLARHADTLWQCDFVSKPMWSKKGLVNLYLLVFLHLGTRRCWISSCTTNPDSHWVTQQAKNFLMDAEEMQLTPQIVMRDNDTKFTVQFDSVFESRDAKIKRNTPLSPNLRAHVERFIQTLQVECLDKFLIVAERHLNHISRQFEEWYNTERPHEARDHLPPTTVTAPNESRTIRRGDLVCNTRLGGVLKSYSRRAA